ncbi:hypothetical protein [Falsiruegeria mediterranea]
MDEATIVVTTTADELDSTLANASVADFGELGDISLREANALSKAGDTIQFDGTDFTGGATSLIRLFCELEIGKLVEIDGSTATDVVISGDANSDGIALAGTFITDAAASDAGDLMDDNARVFNITTNGATFVQLTITGGNAIGLGGGGVRVASGTNVTFEGVTVAGNSASFKGRGDLNQGVVTFSNSTVFGNKSGSYGGDLTILGTMTLTNTTISGNTPDGERGDIHNNGSGTITNSTISRNFAEVSGGSISQNGAAITLTISLWWEIPSLVCSREVHSSSLLLMTSVTMRLVDQIPWMPGCSSCFCQP